MTIKVVTGALVMVQLRQLKTGKLIYGLFDESTIFVRQVYITTSEFSRRNSGNSSIDLWRKYIRRVE